MNQAPLTDYERQQICKIAGWKAEPPSYLSAVLDKVTRPLVKAVEHVVPPDKIAEAIENAYASAETASHRVKIAQRANVANTRELLDKNLEFCDQLADKVAWESSKQAMFWGAAAGGQNLVSTLISLNALMTYCLKTIHSIGYCYGFSPDEPHERAYVLSVLLVACASTLKEKQEAAVTLNKIQDMIFEEAFEDLLQDAVVEEIIMSTGLTTIPLVGMLTGAMYSASLTEHTAAVAKYCFMERWLIHHQKIDIINPDRKLAHTFLGRSRLRVENNVYWGAFGVSFLMCVPVAWLLSWIPANPAFRGIADGRIDASTDAVRLVKKVTGVEQKPLTTEALVETAVV